MAKVLWHFGNVALWLIRNLATRQRYIDETFGNVAIQQIVKGKMVYGQNGQGNMVKWQRYNGRLAKRPINVPFALLSLLPLLSSFTKLPALRTTQRTRP
jgi:hypothetical protein